MKDTIVLGLAIIFLIVPFVLVKLWWWVYTMGSILLVVVILEALCYLSTKQTLSQRFQRWSKTNKVKAWMVAVSVMLAMAILMYHLLEKIV